MKFKSKNRQFAGLPMAKKVILGENVWMLDKDAFAGTNLSQLVVNSMTMTIPGNLNFDRKAGLTILCHEKSAIAEQLTDEFFADLNITLAYPVE